MKAIYKENPFVILSRTNIVLAKGTEKEMRDLHEGRTHFGDYYTNCKLAIREYDLHGCSNEKIEDAFKEDQVLTTVQYVSINKVRAILEELNNHVHLDLPIDDNVQILKAMESLDVAFQVELGIGQ